MRPRMEKNVGNSKLKKQWHTRELIYHITHEVAVIRNAL